MNYRILPALFLATLLCLMTANFFLVLHGPDFFDEMRSLMPDGVSWRRGGAGTAVSSAEWLRRVDLKLLFFAALAVAGGAISVIFVRKAWRLARARSLEGQ